jgi:hypothetical protein
MARRLEAAAPHDVLRVPTDGRPVTEIASEIITATTWPTQPAHNSQLGYQ